MGLLVGGPLECSWIQGKSDFEIEAGLLGPIPNSLDWPFLLGVFANGPLGGWSSGMLLDTGKIRLRN